MKTEDIARVTYEANRAYCATLGDNSRLAWDDTPEWQRKSAINGVSAIKEGRALSPADTHQSWLDEKARTGWVFGLVKDPVAKTHPCCVPYSNLPTEQKVKDYLFLAVARTLLGA